MKTPHIETAFLPGAGLGMRMRPLTQACPKPLLRVGGRPIISYAMDHLIGAGVRRFIVNTHHCPEVYRKTFPDARWRGVPILFRHEPILLDTAGGLKNIEDLLEGDERLLVYNADVITNLPLMPLLEAHAAQGTEVTLVLRSEGPLCNVDLDENGRICDLRHMLERPGVKRCLFAGIYLVEKRFLARLTAGRIESVVPVFVRMIAEQSGSVGSVLIDDGEWHDIGNPEEYRRITQQPGMSVKENRTLPPEGPQPRPEDNEQAKPFETISDADVRRYVSRVLGCRQRDITGLSSLAKGGSDRTFRRVRFRTAPPLVCMHYNSAREENRLYAAIAGFLRETGIVVPEIYHHDSERCLLLMEDLGDADLLSMRQSAWSLRRGLYQAVLRMIQKLHACPVKNLDRRHTMRLMPGFGPELYRWEREYFYDNLIRGVCGIELGASELAALEAELDSLARRLGQSESCLIHRDFQSQNIMITRGEPVLIDFQGMRPGSYYYDLGSLLYDPYVPIDEPQRLELLRYYYGLRERNCAWDAFQQAFHDASAQRLMQALGAFGFLGLRHHRQDFLAHVPTGLQRLEEAVSRSGRLPVLQDLVARCRSVRSHSGPF